MCKASINLIQSNYYWILGNGQKIKVWESSILGHPSLSSLPGMVELAEWAHSFGILTLHDLSLWNSKGIWIGWKDLHPSAHLEEAKNILFSSLHGMSPTNEDTRYSIDWGKND